MEWARARSQIQVGLPKHCITFGRWVGVGRLRDTDIPALSGYKLEPGAYVILG